jgi:hypothetical protein
MSHTKDTQEKSDGFQVDVIFFRNIEEVTMFFIHTALLESLKIMFQC